MNKIVFLALLTLALSCKKDNSASKFRNNVAGTWEYKQFSGYPFINPYLPPGNGRIIALSTNGTFERRQHDTVLFRGRYYLEEKNRLRRIKKN